jgi:hypothetical protein
MHPMMDVLAESLRTDIEQMAEEGHDPAALRVELEAAIASGSADALLALQEDWWSRPSPATFPYEEPSDWPTLSAGFPDPDSHARFAGSDADLADRLHAAWLGRCVGCQLGKPLEGLLWPEVIRLALQAAGSWPLADYMNPLPEDRTFELKIRGQAVARSVRSAHCRGNFHAVSPDDDIHYALISQDTIARHGVGFTGRQAMANVIRHTPGGMIFAAGRNMYRTGLFGLKPPHTAIFGNAFRQSLGAMIRCDPFGWAAPANPALAARMAFTDAACSQTRNGIYSGIFFAVLMADVLAHGDPIRAIRTATAHVPPRSRFAEMLAFMRQQADQQADWRRINAAIIERWPGESARFNHAIPNAAIVLLGLYKGGGDFSKTLGITVMAGLDTDCTGATVGSILGCALGTAGIPGRWTQPFGDTIHTDLMGMRELRISQVAARLFDIAKGNVRRKT